MNSRISVRGCSNSGDTTVNKNRTRLLCTCRQNIACVPRRTSSSLNGLFCSSANESRQQDYLEIVSFDQTNLNKHYSSSHCPSNYN